MNKKLQSLGLILCMFFSAFPAVYAEESQKPKEITLTMASNKIKKSSINGLYSDSEFYITAEELCALSGGILESSEKDIVQIAMYDRQRCFEIEIGKGKMTEKLLGKTYEASIPSFVYEGKNYIAAVPFLNYIGATVKIEKDAEAQFQVLKRYDLFDALADYKKKQHGYYFSWNEVDTGKEKLTDKIFNAGIISMINRDSGIFRMAIDAKGIQREAVQDALLTIVTNEGQNYLDETDLGAEISNAADMLELGRDAVDLIADAYDDHSKAIPKDFKEKLGTISDTASKIDKGLQIYNELTQFDSITNVQHILMKDTILTYHKDSKVLCKDWKVVYEAAQNIDQQIRNKYDKYYKLAMKEIQSKGYEFLGKVAEGPILPIWGGINTLAKNIPLTKEIISKKDKLYNASIIQDIANEMLVKSYSDWYNGTHADQKETETSLWYVKQTLILQLKSTLTTREYLQISGFLTPDYAADMKNTNTKLAKFLNQVESCKITVPGFFAADNKIDCSWMNSYESSCTSEQAAARWKQFISSGEYKDYTDKWEHFWDDSPMKYEAAIQDLNADGIPECIIIAADTRPFYHTDIFALNKNQIVLVNDQYGYGTLRYSPSQNLIIGVSETRPSANYGDAPFYSLQGTVLSEEFYIVKEEDKSYYFKNNTKKQITNSERESYFADAEELEWKPIS